VPKQVRPDLALFEVGQEFPVDATRQQAGEVGLAQVQRQFRETLAVADQHVECPPSAAKSRAKVVQYQVSRRSLVLPAPPKAAHPRLRSFDLEGAAAAELSFERPFARCGAPKLRFADAMGFIH
jgi:hypothetical protein